MYSMLSLQFSGAMSLKHGTSHTFQTWRCHTCDLVSVCAGALVSLQALRLQAPHDQQGESVKSVLYKLTH